MRMPCRRLAAVLLLLAATPALAQRVEVYRSVDAHGNVSFSDRPPSGTASERLEVDASAPPPSPEVAERRAEMSRVVDELRATRLEREAGAAAAAPPQQPSGGPPPQAEPTASHDYWLPVWYPTARPPRPPQVWPSPPRQPPPIPRPNPDSDSPRGLQERLRRAR
jgi:hypothetical protein